MKKIKVAALFSGCGGLDLGFAQAGYKVIWANEISQMLPCHMKNY